MRRESISIRLLLALCISLLVHGIALAPLLGFSAFPAKKLLLNADEKQPTEAPQQTPPEPDPLTLGIDADTPSSLTWIGYDEYQEQIAQHAPMDQAALTENPSVASAQPAPTPAPTPAEAAAESPQPPPPPVLAHADVQSPKASPDQPVDQPDSRHPDPTRNPPLTPESIDPPESPDAPVAPPSAAPLPFTDPLITIDSPDDAPTFALPQPEKDDEFNLPPSASQPDAQDSEQPTDADTPTEHPADSPNPSANPSPATPPSTPNPGDPADADSDPTSIVNVPEKNWRLGKPLAAHGLTVRPHRPQFTNLQAVTAAGANPLCRIVFDRTGRVPKIAPDGLPDQYMPVRAEILQSSGNSEIDFAIKTSLYRWRASGKALDQLKDKQTIELQIRLILFSR
ncbi:MAG TPA: hypothetical protein VG711_00950 [Phycisphaerales bacterium]|nr:hypothetical protein [Phycisphaerales bacterium]